MAGTGDISQDGKPSADRIVRDIEGHSGVQVWMDLLPLLQGSPFRIGQIAEMGPFSNGSKILIVERNWMMMRGW
jgi:hypothetical protein